MGNISDLNQLQPLFQILFSTIQGLQDLSTYSKQLTGKERWMVSQLQRTLISTLQWHIGSFPVQLYSDEICNWSVMEAGKPCCNLHDVAPPNCLWDMSASCPTGCPFLCRSSNRVCWNNKQGPQHNNFKLFTTRKWKPLWEIHSSHDSYFVI